jgi:MFS family permease
MTAYRNVASLIIAVMLLQAASGILSVSTPLALKAMGASALGVGVVAATFSGGFMLGSWYAPDVVRQVGHIRAYSAAAAIYSAGILGMALAFDSVAWGLLRFAQGAASAVMFTAAESWIADSTPRSKRGGVLGMYQLMLKIAICCGPLLIVEHAPADIRPFIWAGLLMVLAVIPLCATRREQPVQPDREPLSLSKMMQIPPAALAGAVVAGIANTGTTAQLPLYATELQPFGGSSSAATLYIAAMAGGTITQWPAGLLSDKIDRRLVVAGLAAIAFASCVALYLSAGHVPFSVTVLLAGLWGAGALSFYSISASHATDRTAPGQIAQVMSGMLFVWAGGSVIGPILTGVTADTAIGQPGVFAVTAVLYFGLFISNIWRVSITARPEHRTHFVPVAATSVVEGQVANENPELAEGDSPPQKTDKQSSQPV